MAAVAGPRAALRDPRRRRVIPLFWRLFVPNAAVLVAACFILILAPPNGRVPVLVGGLVVMLLSHLVLMRWAFAPLQRLFALMRRVDPLAPGRRLSVGGPESEVTELTRAFNDMLDRLEDGVQARERLIADASHELRTPLAAMRAELDVSLAHDGVDGPARAALQLARDDAVRLTRIVDNLLTLARVDQGRLELLVAPHDLSELAHRAARSQRAAATERGIDVAVYGDEVVAEVDRERFEQVLNNLLDNAIRHSPDGGRVSLAIAREAGETRITVTDQGPGIPLEMRSRVFERFSRQDPARPRGGAGLGLAICREIIHAHGGRVWIDDAPPPGTTIHVALAASAATLMPWPPPATSVARTASQRS